MNIPGARNRYKTDRHLKLEEWVFNMGQEPFMQNSPSLMDPNGANMRKRDWSNYKSDDVEDITTELRAVTIFVEI